MGKYRLDTLADHWQRYWSIGGSGGYTLGAAVKLTKPTRPTGRSTARNEWNRFQSRPSGTEGYRETNYLVAQKVQAENRIEHKIESYEQRIGKLEVLEEQAHAYPGPCKALYLLACDQAEVMFGDQAMNHGALLFPVATKDLKLLNQPNLIEHGLIKFDYNVNKELGKKSLNLAGTRKHLIEMPLRKRAQSDYAGPKYDALHLSDDEDHPDNMPDSPFFVNLLGCFGLPEDGRALPVRSTWVTGHWGKLTVCQSSLFVLLELGTRLAFFFYIKKTVSKFPYATILRNPCWNDLRPRIDAPCAMPPMQCPLNLWEAASLLVVLLRMRLPELRQAREATFWKIRGIRIRSKLYVSFCPSLTSESTSATWSDAGDCRFWHQEHTRPTCPEAYTYPQLED
ncbi:hypothetical protein JB92DRAFT_3093365 [Gautieria morchelliformis]|nr:hypothetical protein JB92DRAFT_3093365 [Gautieria morchelliformis]